MMNVEITGPTSAKEQKPNHDRFERNARIIIYLSSLAGFLLLGNSIYLTINAGADPLSIGVYALELLMSLAGIWLVHSGRYRTAVNIVVGFNLVAMIILPFVSGQGISQQTIFLAPWLILIALLTLEWKNARIVIGTALLSAITSVLLDLYLPFEREALIGSNFPLFITLGVMILLLTYVAFRQLPTATIRTRLLSGFVGLVIIPLILVTAYSAYINFRTSRNELEI